MSTPATLATTTTTTPPDSFTCPPLTPPPSEEKGPRTPISHIIEAVHDCQRGQRSLSPWQQFPLLEEEYNDLLLEIDKESDSFQGFWHDKLRYDYFPSSTTFVLRMPTVVHEKFITSVIQETVHQLQTLACADSSDSPNSDFAREINSEGSTTISFPDEYGRHDPDVSFRHQKAKYPGVILEVSYSQKRKDLARLADDYILGSGGDVRAVVGLDIKNKEGKRKLATVSIWRPRITINDDGEEELIAHQDVKDFAFRDTDGEANPSSYAGLSLQLDDFATTALHVRPMPQTIFIPATSLCEFLGHAEKAQLMLKKGAESLSKNGLRKRRTQSTSTEEMSPAREKRFEEEEYMAESIVR